MPYADIVSILNYQRLIMIRHTSTEYRVLFEKKYIIAELAGLILFIAAIIKQM